MLYTFEVAPRAPADFRGPARAPYRLATAPLSAGKISQSRPSSPVTTLANLPQPIPTQPLARLTVHLLPGPCGPMSAVVCDNESAEPFPHALAYMRTACRLCFTADVEYTEFDLDKQCSDSLLALCLGTESEHVHDKLRIAAVFFHIARWKQRAASTRCF